ncbi:MAG TPA: hypothetical protein VLB68_01235 [Pyrinomonadaceae bacterium]|nr:hypothetical protein [Pyrinomonadaceae bacterium]
MPTRFNGLLLLPLVLIPNSGASSRTAFPYRNKRWRKDAVFASSVFSEAALSVISLVDNLIVFPARYYKCKVAAKRQV